MKVKEYLKLFEQASPDAEVIFPKPECNYVVSNILMTIVTGFFFYVLVVLLAKIEEEGARWYALSMLLIGAGLAGACSSLIEYWKRKNTTPEILDITLRELSQKTKTTASASDTTHKSPE